MGRPKRDSAVCHHNQPKHFKAGEPLDLEISIEKNNQFGNGYITVM